MRYLCEKNDNLLIDDARCGKGRQNSWELLRHIIQIFYGSKISLIFLCHVDGIGTKSFSDKLSSFPLLFFARCVNECAYHLPCFSLHGTQKRDTPLKKNQICKTRVSRVLTPRHYEHFFALSLPQTLSSLLYISARFRCLLLSLDAIKINF